MDSVAQSGEWDVPGEIPPVPGGEGRDVVPENIPPVPEGEEWDSILKAVHRDAQFEEGHWHDVEDIVGDALLTAWIKRDQFDPGRGASRITLVKAYRRGTKANTGRRRTRQSTLSLDDLDCPDGGQSGEYKALNDEWRTTVALAARRTYESPEIGPDVRKAVILTIAGEDQKTIAGRLGTSRANSVATQLFDYRGRVATPLLLGFQRHFEEEMRRGAIGGCIKLDGLYGYCAEADLAEADLDGREPLNVAEFRKCDNFIDITFERVSRDVDRILVLIAADVDMPMFVRDVVVNRLEAISEIVSNHSGVIPVWTDLPMARPDLSQAEFVIARLAVCLVLRRFPYFADIPSLASFASWIGIDVTDD